MRHFGVELIRQILIREQIFIWKPVKGVSDEKRDMGELCDAHMKRDRSMC